MAKINPRQNLSQIQEIMNRIKSTAPLNIQQEGSSFLLSNRMIQTYYGENWATGLFNLQSEVLRDLSDPDGQNLSLRGRQFLGQFDSPSMRKLKITALAANGELDLNLFNKTKRAEYAGRYAREVLHLNQTIQELGFPAYSAASDNQFNHFFQFLINPTSGATIESGIHPATFALGGISIQAQKIGGRLEEAVKTAKGKMISGVGITERAAQGRRMLETRAFPGRQSSLNIYGVAFGKSNPITGVGTPGNVVDRIVQNYDAARYDIVPGEIFEIITTDIETTGITQQSQMRSASYRRRRAMYDSNGNLTYLDDVPDPVTVHLSTGRMDQAQMRVKNVNGQFVEVPMSEYATAKEAMPGDIIVGGSRNNVLAPGAEASDVARAQADEISKMLDVFTGYDPETKTYKIKTRLQGHNIERFDTRFFNTHMLSLHEQMTGGLSESHIESLMRFNTMRIENPFFITDTMISIQAAVGEQVGNIEKILSEKGVTNKETILTVIHDSLLDKSIRDKAITSSQVPGKSSVENAILNSNLLQLIEDEGLSDGFLELLERQGTHSSMVDATLSEYMSKFIESGQFKIQLTESEVIKALEGGNTPVAQEVVDAVKGELQASGHMRNPQVGFTAFEKLMRRKATSSGAIVLNLNVTDVQAFSDQMFGFVANTQEGQNLVSLSVDADTLEKMGVNTDVLGSHFEGTLQYNLKNKQFGITGYEDIDIDQDKARSLIQRTLNQAREDIRTQVDLGAGKSLSTNVANDAIQNIKINTLQLSQAEEILKQRQTAVNLTTDLTKLTDQEIIDRIGTTRSIFGEQIGQTGQVVHGTGQIPAYQSALLQRGLPFAQMEARSRVLGTEMSKATSQIGEIILSEMAEEAKDAGQLAYGKKLQYAATSGAVQGFNEYGFVYAMGQGSMTFSGLGGVKELSKNTQEYARIVISGVDDQAKKMIIPWEIFRNLQVDHSGERVAMGSSEYLAKRRLQNSHVNSAA